MDPKKARLQEAIIQAAKEVCDQASPLPGNIAQISADISNALEQALVALSEFEEEEYADHLFSIEPPIWGIDRQMGLNSAQVALQRLEIDQDQLAIERLIDAADQLCLAIFDDVVVPGFQYQIRSTESVGKTRYIHQSAIEDFQKQLDVPN